MFTDLNAGEISKIVSIFRTAVANRDDADIVLEQIFSLHNLNTDLIVKGKTVDQVLVTALLLVLESPDCYELASSQPPLVVDVIKDLCVNRPLLHLSDWEDRLASDLNL